MLLDETQTLDGPQRENLNTARAQGPGSTENRFDDTALNATEDRQEAEGGNGFEAMPAWKRPRGAIQLKDRRCIGRVGAPPSQEATSSRFCFWIPEEVLVEATQIVTARCAIPGDPGKGEMTYYALVEEVHRCSRRRGMGHEVDEFDGDLADEPIYASEGITYANAAILRTEPPYLTPPRERTPVLIASDEEAQAAYGANEIKQKSRLAIGLIKNGGATTAGPGFIDLDYLLGANGGHLNVSGAAGRATKSSFLLNVIYLLLAKVARDRIAQQSEQDPLRIVPIIFNVKNFDLLYIDRWNRDFDSIRNATEWNALGIENPGPFKNTTFYAPQAPNEKAPIQTGRTADVKHYSWALKDVVECGLLTYLFSEEDAANENFIALVLDLENWLTDETIESDGSSTRRLRQSWNDNGGQPIDTFGKLSDWLRSGGAAVLGNDHHEATRKKLSRRLLKLLYESGGVLRRDEKDGAPLNVTKVDTCAPIVIDLNGLAGRASLQRFVVATVLRQLVDARTGSKAIRNLKYLVTLDELNRFAPKGGHDPITKLIETVASEMRSQGVLLFGAQQQASLVSTRVIENCAVKVLGQTGALELGSGVWSTLSEAAKRRAEALFPNEKLILQSGFRQPMHVLVPFPAWAMNREEAEADRAAQTDANGTKLDGANDLGSFGDA